MRRVITVRGAAVPLHIHDNIFRFQVTVVDPEVMAVLDRGEDLDEEVGGLRKECVHYLVALKANRPFFARD